MGEVYAWDQQDFYFFVPDRLNYYYYQTGDQEIINHLKQSMQITGQDAVRN